MTKEKDLQIKSRLSKSRGGTRLLESLNGARWHPQEPLCWWLIGHAASEYEANLRQAALSTLWPLLSGCQARSEISLLFARQLLVGISQWWLVFSLMLPSAVPFLDSFIELFEGDL
jgi:hypothetical protein